MPIKSHSKQQTTPRRTIRETTSPQNLTKKTYVYESFDELCRRIIVLKLTGWLAVVKDDRVLLTKEDPDSMVPKFEVVIDDSLAFSVSVYNWLLPPDHPLCVVNKRSMRHISVSSLIRDLDKYKVCNGLSRVLESQYTVNHVIPKRIDPFLVQEDASLFQRFEICPSLDCEVIYPSTQCDHCKDTEQYALKIMKRKSRKANSPASIFAPVSKTTPERLKLALQEHRLECRQLENELEKMQTELRKNSVHIDSELNKDFISILDSSECQMTLFMK